MRTIPLMLLVVLLTGGSVAVAAAGPTAVGLLQDERFRDHKPGDHHPERPERLAAIDERLAAAAVADALIAIEPRIVDERWLLAAHSRDYLDLVEQAHEQGRTVLPTGDTALSTDSVPVAKLAVGGILAACDGVMDGERYRRAFCAVRPPGHHAKRERGMGFCIYANVAIAARYLQEHHGIERILVVDFDVHHGNGTYDVLKDNAGIYQWHMHQSPLYPNTGSVDEVGEGEATGMTTNNPLPAGSSNADYLALIDTVLIPAMAEFRPQVVLVSAGFDAHRDDPLGGMHLTADGYHAITDRLVQIADTHGEGRLVSVLEGGYDLEGLAASVLAHVESLAGIEAPTFTDRSD